MRPHHPPPVNVCLKRYLIEKSQSKMVTKPKKKKRKEKKDAFWLLSMVGPSTIWRPIRGQRMDARGTTAPRGGEGRVGQGRRVREAGREGRGGPIGVGRLRRGGRGGVRPRRVKEEG